MGNLSVLKFKSYHLRALSVWVMCLVGAATANAQSTADKDKIAAESLKAADTQFANKDYSKAIDSYTIVIGLTSSKYICDYALRKRGDAKLEKQDYKSALEDYQQFLNFKPEGKTSDRVDLVGFDSSIYKYKLDELDVSKFYLNMGIAKVRVGDKAGACEIFQATCPEVNRACTYAAEYCSPKTSSSTTHSRVASAQTQLKIGTYTSQSQERHDFKNLIPLSAPAHIQIKIRSLDPDGTAKTQFVRGDLKGDLSGTIDSEGKLLLEGFLFDYSRREFKTKLVAIVKDGTFTKGRYVADSSNLKVIGEFSGSTFSNPNEDEDKLTFTPTSKEGVTNGSQASSSKLVVGTYTANAAETIETRGLPTVKWNKIIQIKVKSLDDEGNIKLELAISGTKGGVAGRIDSVGNLNLKGSLYDAARKEFKLNMTTTIKDGHFANGSYVLEGALVKDTGAFGIATLLKDDFEDVPLQ
jgi:tetratricopeptide (TPR) repeat protein